MHISVFMCMRMLQLEMLAWINTTLALLVWKWPSCPLVMEMSIFRCAVPFSIGLNNTFPPRLHLCVERAADWDRRKAKAQIAFDFGDCITEQKHELLRLLDAWLRLSQNEVSTCCLLWLPSVMCETPRQG